MTTPTPQIVTKPGGLSGTAHAVHILICFFTCGLWIPGYILFVLFAPSRRIEVIAPVGADPQQVAAVRAQAAALTPQERSLHNQRVLIVAILAAVPILFFLFVVFNAMGE